MTGWQDGTTLPKAKFRFTDWYTLANEGNHLNGYSENTEPIEFHDCQLYGGALSTTQPQFNMTNCLLERVYVWMSDDAGQLSLTFANCLFFGGHLNLTDWDGETWTF